MIPKHNFRKQIHYCYKLQWKESHDSEQWAFCLLPKVKGCIHRDWIIIQSPALRQPLSYLLRCFRCPGRLLWQCWTLNAGVWKLQMFQTLAFELRQFILCQSIAVANVWCQSMNCRSTRSKSGSAGREAGLCICMILHSRIHKLSKLPPLQVWL